jgi:hypothetical protein
MERRECDNPCQCEKVEMAQRALSHRPEIAHLVEIGPRLDMAQAGGIQTDLLKHANRRHLWRP